MIVNKRGSYRATEFRIPTLASELDLEHFLLMTIVIIIECF